MFSQITALFCGPFFYPVYFASLLHAFDFFVNSAVPKSIRPEPRNPFLRRSAIDSKLHSAGYQNAKNATTEKEKR